MPDEPRENPVNQKGNAEAEPNTASASSPVQEQTSPSVSESRPKEAPSAAVAVPPSSPDPKENNPGTVIRPVSGLRASSNDAEEEPYVESVVVPEPLKALLRPEKQHDRKNCTLPKGAHIGDYEVMQLVRTAWTGELYLVFNLYTQTQFLMKLFPPGVTNHKAFRKRFESVMANIVQPQALGITHIHKYGCHHGVFDYYYIIYDAIKNVRGKMETLHDLIHAQGHLYEGDVKKIALQLCTSLERAHSSTPPLLHSDLIPENILLDKSNVTHFIEFNTVKILGPVYMRSILRSAIHEKSDVMESNEQEDLFPEEDPLSETASFLLLNDKQNKVNTVIQDWMNQLFGKEINGAHTPLHMLSTDGETPVNTGKNPNLLSSFMDSFEYYSPEQKAGGRVTEQSNIYSMGVILFKMLTGHNITSKSALPSAYHVSKAWDSIIMKSLRNTPHERYQTVSEMRYDIQELRYGGVKTITFFAVPVMIGFVALFLLLFSGNFWLWNDKETLPPILPQDKNNPVITLSTEPLSRFEVRVAVTPLDAEVQIRQNNMLIADVQNTPKEGLSFFVEKNLECELEASRKGFQPLKVHFLPTPEENQFDFPMQKDLAQKTYEFRNHLKLPTQPYPWRIRVLNLLMLPISPGTFVMGTKLPPGAMLNHEVAAHPAKVDHPFWISEYEITQAQYREIMDRNPSFFKAIDPGKAPVERVSLDDAEQFCLLLTERMRLLKLLPDGYVYRLPTEVEWEYCARAGSQSNYCFGDTPAMLNQYAWNKENSKSKANPVGVLKPNPWGIYDMHGNLWEWCLPEGELPKNRGVVRGGSWNVPFPHLRSSSRLILEDRKLFSTAVGFRIVLAPELPKK